MQKRLFIRWTISLAVLFGILWFTFQYRVELSNGLRLIQHTPIRYWISLVILEGIFILMLAMSNKSLYTALRTPTYLSDQVHLVLASGVANRIIPLAGASGMSAFVWLAARLGIPVYTSIQLTGISIVIGTIQGLPILLVPLWNVSAYWKGSTVAIDTALWIVAITTILFFAGIAFTTSLRLIRAIETWSQKYPSASKWVHILLETRETIRWMIRFPLKWLPSLLYLMALYPIRIFMLYIAFQGVGIHAPTISLVIIGYAVSLLLSSASFVPTSLGVFEISLTMAYYAVGFPLAEATAITLLYRFATYWLPIPVGLLSWWVLRKEERI